MNPILTELTQKILGCAFEVSNELGIGFVESVYENSLRVALEQTGLTVLQGMKEIKGMKIASGNPAESIPFIPFIPVKH